MNNEDLLRSVAAEGLLNLRTKRQRTLETIAKDDFYYNRFLSEYFESVLNEFVQSTFQVVPETQGNFFLAEDVIYRFVTWCYFKNIDLKMDHFAVRLRFKRTFDENFPQFVHRQDGNLFYRGFDIVKNYTTKISASVTTNACA